MLLPGGEIHVTHKLGYPYDMWRLDKQAELSGLQLKCLVPFYAETYPGYRRCRGGVLSAKASNAFNISNSGTYMFVNRSTYSLILSSIWKLTFVQGLGSSWYKSDWTEVIVDIWFSRLELNVVQVWWCTLALQCLSHWRQEGPQLKETRLEEEEETVGIIWAALRLMDNDHNCSVMA